MYYVFIIILGIIVGFYFGRNVIYRGPNPQKMIKKKYIHDGQKYKIEIIKTECPNYRLVT